jgi:hypothetical protein
LKCAHGRQVGSVSTRNALLAGAASALRAGSGTAPSSFGDGRDLAATAQMTLALAATAQMTLALAATAQSGQRADRRAGA